MSAQSRSAFKSEFIARVRAARAASRLTGKEVAEALGIEQDSYKQYEGRSLMPHHLIAPFCLACDVQIQWLIAGIGRGPAVLPRPETNSTPNRGRPRRTA